MKQKRKSKNTAILLAVLLGPWAWLYTFANDWKKFFIGIVLWTVALGFLVLGERFIFVLSYSGTLSNPNDVWIAGLVISPLTLLAIYAWAISVTVRKPASWYADYKSIEEDSSS